MPVIPAALGESPSGQAAGVPYSPLYDDVYHAVAGAWAQARHVFLSGNGLPQRWQGRRRFVILETGFGLGNNFLATWAAWRDDPQRCERLVFISIEKHPLPRDEMVRAHGLGQGPAQGPVAPPQPNGGQDAPDKPDEPGQQDEQDRQALASRLIQAWPALTPGLHTLDFDEPALPTGATEAGPEAPTGSGRLTLILGLGDIAELLPAIVASVDAFYLDGFAPAKNPQMWDEGLLSRLNRLAAPGCTAATWSAARGVRDALTQAGFQVERVAGFAGKRDMVRAVYAPRYTPPHLAGGWWPEAAAAQDRHAIVLGAGIAGCAAALALCKQGWRVTLVDSHDGPAQEASGNPGGMFHSVLHAEDGVHARAHRAGAMATWRQAHAWIEAGHLPGQASGLLRLDAKMNAQAAQALLARQGLPPEHVQWLDQAQAQARCGLPVHSGGWLFHQGGWLHPGQMARLMLDEAAALPASGQPLLNCLWGKPAQALRRSPDGAWQILDGGGAVIAQAPTLVLCTAIQTSRLLETLPPDHAVAPLPMSAVRGQITEVDGGRDLTAPLLPVAGSGYVLALPSGKLLCGATTQHHDADPSVRAADHHHNIQQAARLGAWHAPGGEVPDGPQACPDAPWPSHWRVAGRTAWRAATPDRLPLVGALPWSAQRLAAQGAPRRQDQVRLLPRERDQRGGLYAMTGLGSRGITWACLGAELLTHWVTGTPCPVEADLRDALDPARFLVRQLTRGT